MYTIKRAAELAGVSVELLRAWERRYGVVKPSRTAGGYRVYDDDAVARLRAMRGLIEQGSPASLAAREVLAAPSVPARPADGRAPTTDAADEVIDQFVAAAAALDGDATAAALDEMLARGSFERVTSELVMPALVRLGRGWAEGTISVAAEHAATHAVVRRLGAAFEAAGPAPSRARALLVGLPPGSRHELGALAFAVAARRAGMPVLYLGADVPTADWLTAADGALAVVIGVVTAADVDAATDLARALQERHPSLEIALGGNSASSVEGYRVLPDRLPEAVAALRAAVGARVSRRG